MQRRSQFVLMRKIAVLSAALLGLMGVGTKSFAQDEGAPPPVPATAGALRSADELDEMLAPIALYPDPLIGLILPAATVPQQITLADRYLSEGGDPNQISVQPWDPSVQGLAHYPTVLKWMDDNLAWTSEIGVAFASQQSDVMDSIQRLRAKAQSLGNLQNTPQENVESDDGEIDIEPANPDDIYVPDYQDDIYTQPGVYCSFGGGFPIGIWLGFDWDWRHHHLIRWGPDHPRPQGWWGMAPSARFAAVQGIHAGFWQPQPRGGSLIMRGEARGYEPVAPRSAPPVPRTFGASRPAERPSVSVGVIGRNTEEGRGTEQSHAVERSEPSESVFGGAQSSHEVRESSSRGAESRSSGGFSGGFSGGRSGGGGRR